MKRVRSRIVFDVTKKYGDMLQQVLEWLDEELAKQRDEKRYYLKDKRTVQMQTLFGEVEVRRNSYLDREEGVYTCLLDASLGFDGAKGVSPSIIGGNRHRISCDGSFVFPSGRSAKKDSRLCGDEP
ncbi:UPF0236 family transposase-like protein [Anoxybacillus gonensis]|uniref:UPF0236 family protein n=1 Tax=Anoxybacillus gonensis TaxID=198467 RepID=A0AAW7TK03_9BACL|nr:UPF0236 family protein [Anoxybacillus gonensis]MCX8046790.1 UPF0236 family protein [Anoxybacillus gonensis]MDO0878389.1 UPF0236 family protein [Anoxybacillus gonensis]